ncbi:pyrroline-5-carboxylate reductase [Bowmanella pacifica]|uniref:Pyrroline-5-carboxylate reductase n=1 Tax=Bowmanella pacifica TaxID=502051 RepID=A0A917YWI0_9ALTE|nr:pyrroline-5-carboxylate reductase [Bowmanella pacifica]GGO68653.1 pyrroline-5-carboxylate reductase [Bowmanella pacifica]
MQHRKITFVGAGNMSRSIISGMVKSGYPAALITASNPSRPKLDALQQEFGIAVCQNNVDAIADADVVVLAVKPQLMEEATGPLQQTSLAGKLFISIAAGLPVARIQNMLGGAYPIVRTMPNTPSAMGLGMTGLYADAQVSEADRTFAGDLLAQVGKITWVDEEAMLNALTAAAGSSPAYFFLFLEAMQDKAMALGFDKDTARLLVEQAMLGAAHMVCHNPELELSTLRAQVTSKGGTTAAAIDQFEQQGLRNLVGDAMQAAVDRAGVMSKAF